MSLHRMKRLFSIVLAVAVLVPLAAWAVTAAFTLLSPGTPPSVRRSASAAMAPGTADRLHLYGGYNGTILGTQHVYDTGSGNWSTITPVASPGARERHSLGWDPVRGQLVLFGGDSGSFSTTRNEVWVYSPAANTWTLLTNSTSVPARSDALFVYLPHLGKFLVFGGATNVWLSPAWVNDAWLLDAPASGTATWTPLTTSGTKPVASGAHCAAYDHHRRKVILFGGESASGMLSATMQFDVDTNTWSTDPATGDVPSARAFCAASYDSGLRRLVLYGGQNAAGGQVDGLYVYDPVTFVWSLITTLTSPGVLSDTSMAFSPGTGTHLFFGGQTATSVYDGRTHRLGLVGDVGGTSPTADAGADFSLDEDQLSQLLGSGTGGPPLTYQWSQTLGPAVTLTDDTTPTASFRSSRVTTSTALTFSLEVYDGFETATDSVTVTVLDSINEPPTANAGIDSSAGEGVAAGLSATASDPNGEALTYAWVQVAGPPVTLGNAAIAAPAFTTPRVVADTALLFRLTVVDARGGEAIDEVTFTVLDDLNEPPLASAGADQSARVADTVTLDGTASSDPNGEILGFAWTQLSGPALTLSGADTAQPTFVVPAITVGESALLEVMVSDPRGGRATDQVTVQLLPPAMPCAFLSSAGTSTALCGSRYQGAVQVAGDGPFSFSLDSAPTGALIDPLTGAWEWTPAADQGGNHTLAVRCSGEGGDAIQQWAITVDCTPQSLAVGCGCSGTGASPLLLALGCLLLLRRGRHPEPRRDVR